MSFDWAKVFNALIAGVGIANKIGKGKTGPEKLQIALDSSAEIIDVLEAGVDKDLFNDPAIEALKVNAVEAIHALQKGLEAAKQAKGTGGKPE